MRLLRLFAATFIATCCFVACSGDDTSADDDDDTVADAGHRPDATTTRPDSGGSTDTDAAARDDAGSNDGGGDAATAPPCSAASAALQQTGDPSAPVLDAATSQLQRVASNDAFCTNSQATHPDFGGFGYLLNVAYTDADGDAPGLSDLVDPGGFVRFGSAPEADVSTRFDPDHGWTTQGSAQQGTLILQLCLPQAYVAGQLTIAVDLADLAGHRSAAICIGEPTGD